MSNIINKEWDRIPIPSGDRVISAYSGEFPVYKSDIQGSYYTYEIETTGEEVRLINFLTNGGNTWENVETDVYVNWGDGEEFLEYGEKMDTQLYNKGNGLKLTHNYSQSGATVTISIKSVEPLIPVGCKVKKIGGTWPEDSYLTGRTLCKYEGSDNVLNKLNNIRQTVTTLGTEILNLSVNNITASGLFSHWIAINNIGQGFFKDNILRECTSFMEAFRGCTSLETVTVDLLGEANNVVTNLEFMFNNTKVNNTLNLSSSTSLETVASMYSQTKVTTTTGHFLSNCTALINASSLFMYTELVNYNDDLLINSSKMITAESMFSSSKINHLKLNMKKWKDIRNIRHMCHATYNLATIIDGLFSGDFAKDTNDLTLDIDGIFVMAGLESGQGVTIPRDLFEHFRNKNKIKLEVREIFTNAHIKSIPVGLFNNMFKHNGYKIFDLFKRSTIMDKTIPKHLEGCTGITSLTGCYSETTIDDIDRDMFRTLVNLTDITALFKGTTLNFRFYEDLFHNCKKISKWNELFRDAVYKYADYYSIDNLINSNVDYVECTNMFARNMIIRRIFNYDAICKLAKFERLKESGDFTQDYQFIVGDGRRFEILNGGPANVTPATTSIYRVVSYKETDVTINRLGVSGQEVISIQLDNDPIEKITIANGSKLVKQTRFAQGITVIKVTGNVYLDFVGEGVHILDVNGEVSKKIDIGNEAKIFGTATKYVSRYSDTHNSLKLLSDNSEKCGGYIHPRLHKYISNHPLNRVGYPTPVLKNYLEIQLGMCPDGFRLKELVPNALPAHVTVIDRNGNSTDVFVTDYSQKIQTGTSDAMVRIQSLLPIWVDVASHVYGIFGELPPAEYDWKFGTLAPNVMRIGATLLNFLPNKSYESMFKNCTHLEHIPEQLLSQTHATNFTSMFENCTSLKRIPDYLLTNIADDIDCTRMFKGCTDVTYVCAPICDSVEYKINVTDMFAGVKTRMNYNSINRMFSHLWIKGNHGLTNSDDVSFAASMKNPVVITDGTRLQSQPLELDMCYFIHEEALGDAMRVSESEYIRIPATALDTVLDLTKIPSKTDVNISLFTNYNSVMTKFVNKESSRRYIINKEDFMYTCALKYFPKFGEGSTFTTGVDAWYMLHMEHFTTYASAFKNINLAPQTSMRYLMPLIMRASKSVSEYFEGTKCSNPDVEDAKMSTNTRVVDFSRMFKNSDLYVTNINFFKRCDAGGSNIISLTEIFRGNVHQTSNLELFKTFGPRLKVRGIDYAYAGSSIKHFDSFDECTHLESIRGVYSSLKGEIATRIIQESEMPVINKLTKLRDMEEFLNGVICVRIPNAYIKVDIGEDTLDMTRAFANCNAVIQGAIIDPSSHVGLIKKAFSLENCISVIGDDEVIFAPFNILTTPEEHSRVIIINKENSFYQEVEILPEEGLDVRLELFGGESLSSITVNAGMIAVDWGDNSAATVVVGQNIPSINTREKLPKHHYAKGRYVIRIYTANGDALYLNTPESTENKMRTISIQSRFPAGTRLTNKDYLLYNMFGTYVSTVVPDLFDNIASRNTITSLKGLFFKFKSLTTIPYGILDGFTALENLAECFMQSSGRIANKEIGANFISRLSHLKNIDKMFFDSHINEYNDGFFSNSNASITSMVEFAAHTSYSTFRNNFFEKLTGLINANRVFAYTKVVVNETMGGIFTHNKALVSADGMFLACKIKSIPDTIFNGATNLTSVVNMFGTDGLSKIENQTYEQMSDDSEWTLSGNLFRDQTRMTRLDAFVAGRTSCVGYDKSVFDNLRNPTSFYGMFYKTSIKQIHEFTIHDIGESGVLDCRYMFAGTHVRRCPKPIDRISKTVQTYYMLDTVSGYPTEAELFDGITTDPNDIHSMYIQEFKPFMIDVTNGPFGCSINLTIVNTQALPDTDIREYSIDWGDGSPVELYVGKCASLEDLASKLNLSHSYTKSGKFSIRISAPHAILPSPDDNNDLPDITKIHGVMGPLRMQTHPELRLYKLSSIEEVDLSYENCKELTSLKKAFYLCDNIRTVNTTIFDHLTNVTTVERCFSNTALFVDSEHAPSFAKMTGLTNAYACFSDSGLEVADGFDYRPFGDLKLKNLSHAFDSCRLKRPLNIDLSAATDIVSMYSYNATLTDIPADFFMNIALEGDNLSIYSMFRNCTNLTNITGDKTHHSILNINPNIQPSMIHMADLFYNTSLKNADIIDAIKKSNLFNTTRTIILDMPGIFAIDNGSLPPDVTEKCSELNLSNRSVRIYSNNEMFKNRYINNITKFDVDYQFTNESSVRDFMLNCFASEKVNHREDVTGFVADKIKLTTTNVFNLTITASANAKLTLADLTPVDTAQENINYLEIVVGDRTEIIVKTPRANIASKEVSIPEGTTNVKVISSDMIVPKLINAKCTELRGKFSSDNNTHVDEGFMFGTYFPDATVVDFKLNGVFYVKDSEGNKTLNSLFKGMPHITEYSETIFKSYYDLLHSNRGDKTIGTTITRLNSTFEDNSSLNRLPEGQLQYLPELTHIDKMYKNCVITKIPSNYFLHQKKIESAVEAFANNRLTSIPTNLFYVSKKK